MSFRGSSTEERLKEINQEINETYDLQGGINHVDGINLPSYVEVIDIVKKMMQLLFPGFYGVERIHSGNLNSWSAYLLDMVYQTRFKIPGLA